MIALEINGRRYTKFNEYRVSLKFNSVASTFSFNFYDDGSEVSKILSSPGKYVSAVVKYIGSTGIEQTLITGTVLTHSKIANSKSQYVSVAGYSKPGIIEDCQIPTNLYPLQTDGKTFKQIAERVIQPFGLKLVVDPSIASRVNKSIPVSTAKNSETIQSYLYELAYNRNLILSHDDIGNLLITKANAGAPVTFDFSNQFPSVEMQLEFDGQSMHSDITVVKQADSDGGNAGTASRKNPYVGIFRPSVRVMTSGDDIDISDSVNRELAKELSSIRLTINLDRWEINGQLLKPNSIVTVLNPVLGINKSTRFFVESIDYTGDNTVNEATLSCVLPEVYNGLEPKNIFE